MTKARLALDLRTLDRGWVLDAPMGVTGWPGQYGQASPAALSQTVNTKSITGASGPANSSQDFERSPSMGYSLSRRT